MFELPPPQVDGDEARELADGVLSGRAYTEAARPPSLQERLFEWLGDLISDLFSALTSSGGRGIFAWVIIGVFAALIVFLLMRLLRNLDPLPPRTAQAEPTIDVIGGRTQAQWLQAAEEAEATGDYRTGIRSRHQAMVAGLLGQGIVVARPGLTAGEIHAMVAQARPASDDAMHDATVIFKDTWYGWLDADAAMRDRFVALSAEIQDITARLPVQPVETDPVTEPVGVA